MGGPEERGGPGRGAPRSLEPGGGQRPRGPPGAGGRGEEGEPPREDPGGPLEAKRSALRDVGTQVSWAPGGGEGRSGTPQDRIENLRGAPGGGESRSRTPQARIEDLRGAPGGGEGRFGTPQARIEDLKWTPGGGEGHSRTAGEDPQGRIEDLRGGPGRWGAPPARGPPGDLWGAASVAPASQSKAAQDKRASWPGGLCEGCGAPKEGQPRKGGTPRLLGHRAWDLGAPRERLEDSMGLLALGVSRSLSGGLGGTPAKRDPGGWLRKEWPRDPAEGSGQVWVPRKPGRAPERLPWLKEGAVPRKSGADLGQVWIPREKPAPPGGGSGDVWVHKVRNPSGTGIMWVWAKVTNCGEEEAVNEARVWAFQKEGPRKGGEGEGGYGVS